MEKAMVGKESCWRSTSLPKTKPSSPVLTALTTSLTADKPCKARIVAEVLPGRRKSAYRNYVQAQDFYFCGSGSSRRAGDISLTSFSHGQRVWTAAWLLRGLRHEIV